MTPLSFISSKALFLNTAALGLGLQYSKLGEKTLQSITRGILQTVIQMYCDEHSVMYFGDPIYLVSGASKKEFLDYISVFRCN